MERGTSEAQQEVFRLKEQKWAQERETLLKTISLLEQELTKQKAINNTLLKNKKHKRASSEEQTFIFNQTNISSYYPIVVVKTQTWNHRATLRSHLDSVRTAAFLDRRLITAGEDCTLKVWHKDHLELTIREHLGPIYAMQVSSQFVFTAGAEGVIRKWRAQDLLQGHAPIFEADYHDEPIWALSFHSKQNLLLVSSADQSLQLLRNTQTGMNQLWRSNIQDDTPTAVQWLADNRLIAGYRRKDKVGVFEALSGELSWEYSFEGRGECSQVNCLKINPKLKMLVGGHQDHFLRFYDPNTNKKIKEIAAHSDGVTGADFRGQGFELLSCGHDGNLRIWDLRKYKCVSDVGVHLKKYDEGALCLTHEGCSLAVGGADGLVKIFQQGE